MIVLGKCPKGDLHHFQLPKAGGEWECSKCGHLAILPHPGPQQKLLQSAASIAIFGGAKGGGKSYSMLMEAVRHVNNPRFGAVIFRRQSTQIYNEGGLWDTSEKIFPHLKAQPVKSRGEWVFPSGSKVKFGHLEYDKDVNAWDGQQVPMIGFDELTLFSEKQFWYMLTINRSTCGVQPYMRASCNPDADSWVAGLLAWWIDQDTGYPIPERSGKVRWFVRQDGNLEWGNSREELLAKYPKLLPKSLTFIPAKLEDNPTLEAADPGYRANLMAQEWVTQQRLLGGNWKIRPAAGLKFPHDKWVHKPSVPPGLRLVRFWDRAFTEGGHGARTAGVLIGMLNADRAREQGLPQFWIVNGEAGRWGDAEREAKMRSVAEMDRASYGHVTTGIEEEGGAGKHSARVSAKNLVGFDVYLERPTHKKHLRWTPLASQQQVGNVAIVTEGWAWQDFVRELDALAGDEELDKHRLKDFADAAAGGFKGLTSHGNAISGELLASGSRDQDDRTKLTDEELDDPDTPDFIRDLLQSYREDNGGYGDDR